MKNLFFSALLILSASLLNLNAQTGESTAVYKGPEMLPDFTFQSVDKTLLTKANLKTGLPVIVIYFDPSCDHCQLEATWIAAEVEKFSKINLVFTSWGEMPEIIKFMEKYFGPVQSKINVTMMHFSKDTQYKIDKWFGDSPVPSIHIYGSDWKHKQSFFNEAAVEEILKWAK